jgi:hypothetical protein
VKSPNEHERLKDVDPEFARLVSALRAGGPSKDALAKTVGVVESIAKAYPVPAQTSSRAAARASLASWIGAGVGILVLSAAGYEWSRSRGHAGESSMPSVSAPAPVEARDHAESAGSEDLPTVHVEDLPPAERAVLPSAATGVSKTVPAAKVQPSAGTASAPPSEPERPRESDFRDELALVERVRTQLSRGETEACLRTIDQYRERFGGGAFVQEVEVMRVEALATSGDKERAQAVGRRFLSQYPGSPYAERVRSVLEKTK